MSEDFECRLPRAGEWVRVSPHERHDGEPVVLVMHEGERYLVVPEIVEKIEEQRGAKMERSKIFVAQNREGENFLWPVAVPVAEEHLAYRAMHEWICYPLMQ